MSYAGDPRVLFPLFDLSVTPEPLILSYVGVVGQAESGPMWVGKAFSSNNIEAFTQTYGNQARWTRDVLHCIEAMQNGANIVFHRIGHCTDTGDRSTLDILPAFVALPDRGGVDTAGYVLSKAGPFTFQKALSGRVTGTELGPYLIVVDSNDKLKLRVGVVGAWGAEQTITLASGTRTAQQICDDINAQTTGVNATVIGNKVYIEVIDPAHDVEFMAVTNDACSALGIVEQVYAHTVGTDLLVLSVNGGADQSFRLIAAHGEPGQFSLTSAEAAAQIAATLLLATASGSGGRLTIRSSTTGVSSSIQAKAGSTALDAFEFDTEVHSGTAGSVKHPWKFQMIGPGSYANGAKIYFYDSKLNPGTAMNVRITVPDRPEEYFRDLVNDINDPRHWKNYINSHSDYGRIIDGVDEPNAAPADWPAICDTGHVLAEGDDGTLVLTDADWLGDPNGQTGLYCTDHWQMPFIDIFLFGTTSAVVTTGMHEFIQGRKGRFGWSATPPGTDETETVAWRMGDPDHGYQHAAFNVHDSALVAGRFEKFDTRNNERVELSALADLAGSICKTDIGQGRHVSPFGIKRGSAKGVLGIDRNPAENSAAADLLFEYQINNGRILRTSIETRGMEGAYNWGGQTLSRRMSALREVPVVRKVKEYQWMFYPIGLSFINDPNHPVTWREVYRTLNPILRRDLQKGAIYGFALVCDQDAYFTAEGELKGAVLNTGPDIDWGIYRCRMLIQPVRQIFYFVIEMGVMRTGEPFVNYTDMYALPGWLAQAA